MEKIAILVDSGSDLSKEIIQEMDIHVLPLKILYNDGEYLDGETITPKMVYDRFPGQIPKTSTPNFAEITEAAEALRDKGYNKILAICISSGLSSTCQNIAAALSQMEGIEFHVLDTKNISIGTGVFAIHAANLIRKGWKFTDICRHLEANVENSKVFYYMDTLDYLRAGGRIGRVAGAVGSILNIKPIISCNKQGVYHMVSMIRGQKRGMKKLLDCISEEYDDARELYMAVMHGDAPEMASDVLVQVREKFPKCEIVESKQITASLAVHTGPGLIGILIFQPLY